MLSLCGIEQLKGGLRVAGGAGPGESYTGS